MKKLILMLLVMLPLLSTGQSVVNHTGVYILGNANQVFNDAIYSKSFISGAALSATWDTLNPSEDVYDWTVIDNLIAPAKRAGKYISIYLSTGINSPKWVLDETINFPFIDQNIHHDTYNDTLVMPLPYDAIYVAKLCKFIDTFGKRYKNEATIAHIRGAGESVTNGWGLPNTDADGHTWVGYYHYTTDTLLHTMEKVLDTFMNAFPYTPEWLEVGKIPFDNVGHSNIYVGEQIADYGFSKYPDKCNVWREDINACFPTPPDTMGITPPFYNVFWHILYDHPCHNGAQTSFSTGDVNCSGISPRLDPCDASCTITPCTSCTKSFVLRKVVDRALAYHMSYIEFYKADLLDNSLNATFTAIKYSFDSMAHICFPGSGVGHRNAATSVEDLQNNITWNIYPNPTTGDASITMTSTSYESVDIELYDMLGKQLITETSSLNGTTTVVLHTRSLPPGIYNVSLRRNGVIYETRRLSLMK